MSTASLYKRIVRRETHSSRAGIAITLAVLLIVALAWIGTEAVLAAVGTAPLLLAPTDLVGSTLDAASAPVGVLTAAINKAGSTDPNKIRDAILATKGYKGAEGEYNFDQYGDGLHGYNIVKNEKGKIVFDKHIEFND